MLHTGPAWQQHERRQSKLGQSKNFKTKQNIATSLFVTVAMLRDSVDFLQIELTQARYLKGQFYEIKRAVSYVEQKNKLRNSNMVSVFIFQNPEKASMLLCSNIIS